MKKGFRTFQPQNNAWDTQLYFPTPLPFLEEWRTNIAAAQQEFANLSIKERAAFLLGLAAELLAAKDDIQLLYCQESGLSKKRFEAEFDRTHQTLLRFVSHLENHLWEKSETLEADSIQLTKRKLPIGPVLVLGSSNFPLAYSTLGGDTVAAFAAGCCVVLKAHPMHAGTSILVAQCISKVLQKLNLSPFIFSHILDDSYYWASTFAKEPAIKAIGFTGSIKGGRALMDIAAQRPDPIPVFAEMGSLNPVILTGIFKSEELQHTAEKLALSIYTDAGQFCTKPGLILVHEQQLASFLDQLRTALELLQPVPMLHPDIFAKYEARKRHVFQAKGMQRHESSAPIQGIEARWVIAQTNIQNLSNAPAALEEVFGPFAVLCSYQELSQCTALLQQLGGQLTATVFAPEATQIEPNLVYQLQTQVGRLIINGVPTGVRVLETMHHGGPYPASSDPRFSAVGPDSIQRFTKEVCFQRHL
ncbi:MAG: hypothetical protein RL078_1297 [Bacteroidota bacterium]